MSALGAIDRAHFRLYAQALDSDDVELCEQLQQAHDKLAELIAADLEYDAAVRADSDAPTSEHRMYTTQRRRVAHARRAAALVRVGGGS